MKRWAALLLLVSITVFAFNGCSTENNTETSTDNLTLIDGTGEYVKIDLPVERIVSLNSGMSSLICAFGDADKIVGCNSLSVFPSDLLEKEIVGERASKPNMELIIELEPDIVVADTQLKDEDREKLESLGVQVMVEPTSDPERIFFIIRNFGLLLDKQDKAEEIISFMESYLNIIYERIARLELNKEDFPSVYFEYSDGYKSISAQSSMHKNIIAAGGINIAASEPFTIPKLSPEYILDKNPDVIIKRASRISDPEELQIIWEEIMEGSGIKDTDAVKMGNIHIFKSDIFLILNYPAGLSYFAKWFHPDEFSDIDPVSVHCNLVKKFFGSGEWENLKDQDFTYSGE